MSIQLKIVLVFDLLLQKTYVNIFFAISETKILDQNGPKWTIYEQATDESEKCISVVNSRILSVVVIVSVLAPAYTSLYRGLEYLPKVRFIIVVDQLILYETKFWFCRPFFWVDRQYYPISEKQYNKNERHLRLRAHIFTKLSQNLCLIDIHILIYSIAIFGHFHTLLWTIHV